MSDTQTLYKLIILYMLSRVDFPLTNAQISEFILEHEYTSYFKLMEILSEMQDSGFIRLEETSNRTLYHITDEGKETLHFFHTRISDSIRKDADLYFKEKQLDLRNEVSVKANYYKNTVSEYFVRCQLFENETCLLETTVSVPSEDSAKIIVQNWRDSHVNIYADLMQKLLS